MKNKEKYSFDKLRISVTQTIVGITDINIYHGTNCVYYKCYSAEKFTPCWITDFMKWLEEECVSKILTDEEKAYLSAVVKPFKGKVKTVEKVSFGGEEEYLKILFEMDLMSLPFFAKGTMYKGMEANKRYTLEELEL